MSTFTVIVLAIISYFIIGGFIMGLVDKSFWNNIMSNVYFWPVHVMACLIEFGGGFGEDFREFINRWRSRNHD